MTIVGCFLEYNGKFAVLLRHPQKPNGSTWGLPAGKVEQGEGPTEAMARELYEETGHKALATDLVFLGEFSFGDRATGYDFLAYQLTLNKEYSIIIDPLAHTQSKWVSAKECLSLPNLIPDFQELLGLLRKV